MIRPTGRVVDASVVVVSLVHPGGRGEWARARASHALAAPSHIHVEVTSALRRIELADPSATQEGALRILADTPIETWPWGALAWRVRELRHNLTPYDAAYVALAELLDVPLATFDARLARAPGIRCEVELGPAG